ncbi:hypothetical protein Moror_12550 [Moniliophthora roreri MCA 2997]|uniref:F-box domain-containing protein n=2 Tax=Moniliophthora roreri TaxID=221103 RepID=V2X940_MONRO|nr:hypothetical protein Moror_12550 [Moniliophthora roreri MCA 2997]
MTDFMRLCADTHSTIPAAGIRTIGIDGGISGPLLNTFLQWLCSPAPSPNASHSDAETQTARTMADHVLWNVDHLKYNYVFFNHFWALFAEIPKSTILRRVRTLTLSTACLNVIEEFCRLMDAFECLEFLTLRGVSFKYPRQDDSHIFPTLPNTFRRLHIYNSWDRASKWPFIRFRHCQTLRELSVGIEERLDFNLEKFLTGSASVMNGALKLCTIRFGLSLEPSSCLALERAIVASKIPEWVFKGSLEEVGCFLSGIFESDSPLKDPSVASKITGLILEVGGYTTKSRIQSLDKMVESYALFDSLKQVRITIRGYFKKEDLLEAGWSPTRGDWVRPGSKPHIEMEERVKELEQLAPCCTRRGIVRVLASYYFWNTFQLSQVID